MPHTIDFHKVPDGMQKVVEYSIKVIVGKIQTSTWVLKECRREAPGQSLRSIKLWS